MNDSNKRVERKRGFSTECENQKATPNDIFGKGFERRNGVA